MSRKNTTITLLLLALVTAFGVHLADRWLAPVRVDLTEDDLYSLTDGTEQILERMREEGVKPVDVKLYFSETTGKTLPKFIKEFITYERYLRNLLREYERAARGKLRVDFVDPLPDSDEAQQATDYGLDGKLINQEGDLFYFGLAFETQTGGREAIEFLWPSEQETIEYEISKRLYGLLWPTSKRIGVLSSLEVFGSAQDPYMAQMLAAQGRQPTPQWISIQLLDELYEVSQIDPSTDSIPQDEYDLVVVIHPKDLPAKTLAALDEWVVRGGNALVLVDPYAIADQPPENPQQPWAALQYEPSSDLGPLFEAWGIERPEAQFAADLELAVRRPVSRQGGAQAVVVDLQIDQGDLAQTVGKETPITSGLNDLRFLLAGALQRRGEREGEGAGDDDGGAAGEDGQSAGAAASGISFEPLVSTTDQGALITVRPGFGGQEGELGFTDFNDPVKLRDAMRPAGGQLALAYLMQGRFPTAFPEGVDYPDRETERPPGLPPGIDLPPPEDAEMIHKDPVPEEERDEAAVIVFADVDFVTDQLAFVQSPFGLLQAANDNHRLLLNAVDYLLGSSELMSIRSTKRIHRPFELFDEIETAAERETLDRERQIREEVAQVQDELRAKQSEITSRNAALFQKRLQDEVDELNRRIQEGNAELRQIRQSRRAALERQESLVRFTVMGLMPIVVLVIGIGLAWRRRQATA
ncbi:MAG TPA: Gldg family protein [Thermoanaerobaculia bacterium]|nr:Gldg family protein [Thermoanaerobaculia bacterium]